MKAGKIIWLITTVLSVSAVLSMIWPDLYFVTQAQAREFVLAWTPYDYLLFILLQIVQVIIPPISHYFTSILGGFIYGELWGGIYNWIGRLIGQFIAFAIAYKLSDWVRSTWTQDPTLAKFDALVKGNPQTFGIRMVIIFAMIFLPFFPDDELSYLMGLAKFPLGAFALITFFGHLGGSFALAYVGAAVKFESAYFWILTSITIIVTVFLLAYSIKLRRVLKD